MIIFPIGIVWLLILIWSCFKNIKYTAFLVLMSYILQGASVLEVPFLLLKINELSSIVLLVRYIVLMLKEKKMKPRKCTKRLFVFLIFTCLITILSGVLFHGLSFPQYRVTTAGILITVGNSIVSLNSDNLGTLLRLVLSVITFATMSDIRRHTVISEREIENVIKISIWIVTIIGVVQLLTTFGIANFEGVVKSFHYERTTDERMTDSFYRGSMQLYSTFMEASYLAQWIVSVLAYMSFSKEWKHKKLYYVILIVELGLSFSATGIVGLIFIYIYSAINRARKGINGKWFIQYCGIAILAIAFISLTSYGNSIFIMVTQKLDSDSGVERIAYIKLCFDAFIKTYGLGVGFQRVQSMSLFSGLLGQVGFIGTILFIRFLFALYFDKNTKTQNRAVLISIIACNCISCPGMIDHIPLWCILYLVVLGSGQELNKIKQRQ